MAITYGFFNSVNGDRKYSAEQIGRYLQGIVSSGVYAESSTSLQVLANDGMNVEVQPGRAMLHYHYMENDAPLVLTLSAGGALDRIDAIVARMDITRRLCEIVVKQGAEASTPAAPAMSRTDTVKEYMLARVRIPRLTSAITQANITDTRADKTVCGWVTGIIDQVDTSTLFEQWEAAYDAAIAEMGAALEAQQQTFVEWYEALTGNYANDTVLPIPTPVDAAKLLTVKPDGSGYELQAADSTLTEPGRAADAAATGQAIRNTVAKNLLDNSDFKNPVNHTGFAGGVPSVDNSLFIDRWQTIQSATKNINISFSDTGLNIHVTTALAGIRQTIPSPKTGVTFAAKVNGKIFVVYSAHGDDASIKTEDSIMLYVEWHTDTLQALVRNSGEGEKHFTVEWAALYEGEYTESTIPEYIPKGYAAEILNCQVSAHGNIGSVLIWENASPGASFAEQTLALDVSKYKYFVITLRSERAANYYYSCVIDNLPGVNQFLIGYSGADTPSKHLWRGVKVVSGGMWFSGVVLEDSTKLSDGNSYAYPHKIYGVI